MMTICGFDPVKVDTEDKKTLHTLQPRLSKANAMQLQLSALQTLSLKQLLALKKKHTREDLSDLRVLVAKLLQSCRPMPARTGYLLGPVLDVAGSTVQAGGSEVLWNQTVLL